jgi:hypothetical protein
VFFRKSITPLPPRYEAERGIITLHSTYIRENIRKIEGINQGLGQFIIEKDQG